MTPPGKIPTEKAGIELLSAALEADALTTRPTRRSMGGKECQRYERRGRLEGDRHE